jgi:hypothetical protein
LITWLVLSCCPDQTHDPMCTRTARPPNEVPPINPPKEASTPAEPSPSSSLAP